MRTLLKLCYFFSILFLTACGGKDAKKQYTQEKESTAAIETSEMEQESEIILFFGNSLTAGMGLDPEEAFPALVQNKLDSLDLDYTVINAGLSGETTAGGLNRLDWVLKQKVAIFVLELGANDGLRGTPLQETRSNLQSIIDAVLEKNPDTRIVLAGMQMPPNLGGDYTAEFRQLFPELAEKNNATLIPFLLEGVAGIPELNQPDGIHPTTEGQKIVANTVWQVLRPLVLKEALAQ
ncbi:arylesterase [Aggregatimonas sangjinii]|uniref:Arylesterase n=1 Tax=Aggregatimonas sangjinii TaxID=2583587 RepID=A0A5B7SV81_9FLAO|nr:arylesterase [Aggregatimonas sangjinii]QCX00740.1 arylesterase [Aggregatimonas sangjinii]